MTIRRGKDVSFTIDGASVFTHFPIDAWIEAMEMTRPIVKSPGFEWAIEENTMHLGVFSGSMDCLYRIIDAKEIIYIGLAETQTVKNRQGQRMRENKWIELARENALSVQILNRRTVQGRNIGVREAEAVYLKNYKNQHGRMPIQNSNLTRPTFATPDDWIGGIRQLARSCKELEFGLINTSGGASNSPNEEWTRMEGIVGSMEGIHEEIQVYLQLSKGLLGSNRILGISNLAIYDFQKPIFSWEMERIPLSLLYIRDNGEIGSWNHNTHSADDWELGELPDKEREFLERIVDLSLRTYWEE